MTPGMHPILLGVVVVVSRFARVACQPADAGAGPGGFHVPDENIKRFRAIVEARDRGEIDINVDAAPEKSEDQWTISKTFREDLTRQMVGFAEKFTVLEVGAYFGYTTRLLSKLFGRVIALDAFPQFLQANREYNIDRNNILYLKFDTIDDDWNTFATNTIHVIFLDASHDYETVRRDIENCLKIQSVGLIIFDDYGAEIGVRAAVHEYIDKGRLRPMEFLGEGKTGPWSLRDGRTIDQPEGIACEVVKDSQ